MRVRQDANLLHCCGRPESQATACDCQSKRPHWLALGLRGPACAHALLCLWTPLLPMRMASPLPAQMHSQSLHAHSGITMIVAKDMAT